MTILDLDAAQTAATSLSSEPDQPRTLIEGAYRRLRRDIVTGVHPPGEKLRPEHLKLQYNVSAGTLREALGLLVADSLVTAQEQKGFRVAPMSAADLQDLTRTRVVLELAAAEDSVQRGGDSWEASVVSAYHELSLAEKRVRMDRAAHYDMWEEKNRQFHEAVLSACDSRWLKKFSSQLFQQAERYRRLSMLTAEPRDAENDDHKDILDAAISRDIDRLKAILKMHINRALDVALSSGNLDRGNRP